MSAEALAIVITPNLYKAPTFDSTDMQTSLDAIKKSKTYSRFWQMLIEIRMKEKKKRGLEMEVQNDTKGGHVTTEATNPSCQGGVEVMSAPNLDH
eukprot:CAMPEP_0184481352 /NCGR_PEP_ID=MMETSP0113_2-20130426/2914_1 /TAXON_ID=91329 /ORGANISM="Norrisiella sphaerica, Strain BC52" /LENGTH=94 /DNA_ID=CAMNT_0026860445 /DNA_START=301 /DNA_END=585 /DNA_ORIENTATION=-